MEQLSPEQKAILQQLCRGMHDLGVRLRLGNDGLNRGITWQECTRRDRQLMQQVQDLVYLDDTIDAMITALPDGLYTATELWHGVHKERTDKE